MSFKMMMLIQDFPNFQQFWNSTNLMSREQCNRWNRDEWLRKVQNWQLLRISQLRTKGETHILHKSRSITNLHCQVHVKCPSTIYYKLIQQLDSFQQDPK